MPLRRAPRAPGAVASVFGKGSPSSSSSSSGSGKAAKFEPIAAAAQATAVRRAQRQVQSGGTDVYDYDGAYEGMQKERVAVVGARKKEARVRESRYIRKLVVKAEERREEAERVAERRVIKEREEEDGTFADKDRFVTAAYKEKLAERAAKDQLDAEEERAFAAPGGTATFYEGLYSGRNVALGGAPAEPSPPLAAKTCAKRAASVDLEEKQLTRSCELNAEATYATGLEPAIEVPESHRRISPSMRKRPRFSPPEKSAKDDNVAKNATPSPRPKRGLRRNDEASIEAYRQRYYARRAVREAERETSKRASAR